MINNAQQHLVCETLEQEISMTMKLNDSDSLSLHGQ